MVVFSDRKMNVMTCLEAEEYYNYYDDLAETPLTGGKQNSTAAERLRQTQRCGRSRPLNSARLPSTLGFREGDPGVSSQRLLIALWLILGKRPEELAPPHSHFQHVRRAAWNSLKTVRCRGARPKYSREEKRKETARTQSVCRLILFRLPVTHTQGSHPSRKKGRLNWRVIGQNLLLRDVSRPWLNRSLIASVSPETPAATSPAQRGATS